jgi:hypothetical protein
MEETLRRERNFLRNSSGIPLFSIFESGGTCTTKWVEYQK